MRRSILAFSLVQAACAPSLVCREPDVWVTNVEGREDGYCTITFSACEGDELLTVTCDDDTFDGDYDCGWILTRGLSTTTGTFSSPDICRLDTAGMVDAIDAGTAFSVRVE